MHRISDSSFKCNLFGLLGVLFYYVLCLPLFRDYIVRGERILDVFDGQVAASEHFVQQVAQYTLIIPYILNLYVFSYFEFGGTNLLVVALSTIIVYRYFASSGSFLAFSVLAFLFIPVPILILSIFNKDFILVIFLFMAYGCSASMQPRSRHLVFLLYAVFMRFYLVLVPFILMFKRFWTFVIIGLLGFILALSTELGRKVVFGLMNRRYYAEYHDVNSVIIQSTHATNVMDMFRIFQEVLPQVILPFFISPSAKTLYLQGFILILLSMCLLSRNIYALAVLALFVLYTIIDPDLGAFLRHLSALFVIYPLIMESIPRFKWGIRVK